MNSAIQTLPQRIISWAASQVGVSEDPKGSNAGPAVEKYLKSVGLGKGYPWCMAFVYWVVGEACKEAGLTNQLIKTGGVLRQWNEVNPKLKFTKNPKPGDIFIMSMGGANGHTGFVTAVEKGFVSTIEGNTNDEGSREGFEVCARSRKLSVIKGYVRVG